MTNGSADRFGVKDRVIVVTGGSGKLGRVFAEALADAGANVAVLDVAPLETKHPRIKSFVASVVDRAGLERAAAEIEAAFGTPHGLVNSAAIDSPPDAPPAENGPFETYPEASWDKVMDVNAKGTFLCCQVFGAAMARAGRGSIVNIASIYGMVSPDQQLYQYRRDRGEVFFKPVAYAASKSALYNLTRYLSGYWGARNVRVNAVSFGGVFAGQDPLFLAGYCRKVPLGRMAEAEEYIGVVQFLLSEASSYVTGANIVADGGFTAL